MKLPILTEEEKLALSDGTGVHSLEDLVGKADGEEPWVRHALKQINLDGTATMWCGLTKKFSTQVHSGPVRKHRDCLKCFPR